jgi:hypothetical protein
MNLFRTLLASGGEMPVTLKLFRMFSVMKEAL